MESIIKKHPLTGTVIPIVIGLVGVAIIGWRYYWPSDNVQVDQTSRQVEVSPETIAKWSTFVKPAEEELRAQLTPLQYKVTQEEGTELSYNNVYYDNAAEGIYVDIVSGEPLFSSRDKYDSGTGWPSFVQPITPDAVTLHEEEGLLLARTEVRSRYADSHLGHLFTDGPTDRGGKRYCMNSAALRFIPKEEMEQAGYGEYL